MARVPWRLCPSLAGSRFGRLMHLSALLAEFRADPEFARAVELARAGQRSQVDIGAPVPLRPVVAAGLAAHLPVGADRLVLAVTATEREAGQLAAALTAFLPG